MRRQREIRERSKRVEFWRKREPRVESGIGFGIWEEGERTRQ